MTDQAHGQRVNALHLADALESADWSNVSIGNKCMILGAIELLRDTSPAPSPVGLEREEIARAIDSPTVAALAALFAEPQSILTKSYSEQIAEILAPRFALSPKALRCPAVSDNQAAVYEECAKLAEQCALPAYGTNARHTGREEARKKIAAAIRQRAAVRCSSHSPVECDKARDARNFLSWVMEDFDEICAEVGSPRNEWIQEYVAKGFLRHKGTYHGTSCYEITSGYLAALRFPSPRTPAASDTEAGR